MLLKGIMDYPQVLQKYWTGIKYKHKKSKSPYPEGAILTCF
jgi:hypothetical protein